MAEEQFYFYAKSALGEGHVGILPAGYRWELWRPKLSSVVPLAMPKLRFAGWWLLHFMRVFRNRDYSMLLIYHQGQVVHRSVICPKYFRFPFMGDAVLQVGDTWTSDTHRGKGLATFTLQEILRSETQAGRLYWYVVETENRPSILVAEKAGFSRVGIGIRAPRFGIRLLGSYIIERPRFTCLPESSK